MSEQPLILVVDDETHIVHVVTLKLRNAGFRVITASDGQEGLAAALEHQPALVITDYQMPVMTGLDLCLKMREHASTAATPALMLTARGFKLEHEYVQQTNIRGMLPKPFSPRELLSRIQELLNEAAASPQGSNQP